MFVMVGVCSGALAVPFTRIWCTFVVQVRQMLVLRYRRSSAMVQPAAADVSALLVVIDSWKSLLSVAALSMRTW